MNEWDLTNSAHLFNALQLYGMKLYSRVLLHWLHGQLLGSERCQISSLSENRLIFLACHQHRGSSTALWNQHREVACSSKMQPQNLAKFKNKNSNDLHFLFFIAERDIGKILMWKWWKMIPERKWLQLVPPGEGSLTSLVFWVSRKKLMSGDMRVRKRCGLPGMHRASTAKVLEMDKAVMLSEWPLQFCWASSSYFTNPQ